MGLADGFSSRPAATTVTTVITGCSGAGKSTALKAFEDSGFYCVENLPLFLLADLVTGLAGRKENPRRIAVVTDIRDPAFPHSQEEIFAPWRTTTQPLTILFLEASEEVLLRRYSQTRRVHPLASNGSLLEGLRLEREQLAGIRQGADQIIDTSNLTPRELHRCLLQRIGTGEGARDLHISFVSFGYKYGPPLEADLLFDVRFLPNPYFVPELSAKSGLEPEVAAYVMENDATRHFLDLLRPLLAFLIPQYRREGKAYLTVGIGCTGGRHRSVAMVEELTGFLRDTGEGVKVWHRDLDRS
jgi:RNase adapter protein RapZ